MFFIISSIKSRDSDVICYVVSRINLPRNNISVFHLTSIMSLHYLAKVIKMLIAHVLPFCWKSNTKVSLIAPDEWRVFCTPSIGVFLHDIINWIQIWHTRRPLLRRDKFCRIVVTFSDNSVVARAFRVSQSSVETLFRWGGKGLHDFVENFLLETG